MGYRRFLAYVYEYQKEKKGKNSGFVRVQIKEQRCEMEICLQCYGLLSGSECRIYGFIREAEALQGILLGSCKTKENKIQANLEMGKDDLSGSGIDVEDLSGMLFITEDGAYFGTEWDDKPINIKMFTEKQEKDCEKTEKTEVLVESELHAEEMDIAKVIEADIEKNPQKDEAKFTPFSDEEFVHCWKVSACDLKGIFEKNPFLKGNRFLTYGCANYGYLLLAKRSDGKFILGVPGNYDQQECFMAGLFGFSYFKESPDLKLHTKAGYWYRLIDAVDSDICKLIKK